MMRNLQQLVSPLLYLNFCNHSPPSSTLFLFNTPPSLTSHFLLLSSSFPSSSFFYFMNSVKFVLFCTHLHFNMPWQLPKKSMQQHFPFPFSSDYFHLSLDFLPAVVLDLAKGQLIIIRGIYFPLLVSVHHWNRCDDVSWVSISARLIHYWSKSSLSAA